jgi:hypothetical protein
MAAARPWRTRITGRRRLGDGTMTGGYLRGAQQRRAVRAQPPRGPERQRDVHLPERGRDRPLPDDVTANPHLRSCRRDPPPAAKLPALGEPDGRAGEEARGRAQGVLVREACSRRSASTTSARGRARPRPSPRPPARAPARRAGPPSS